MSKLSIITITYNAEKFILSTLKSISEQTFQQFEYIIIDGNSKDKTLSLITDSGVKIDKLISEPDQGIYDAMNKGLNAANGEYVWFMNAGDTFTDKHSVEKVIEQITGTAPDLVYGDANFVNEKGIIRGLRTSLTPHKLNATLVWKDLKFGMLVCHQALIVKKSIAEPFIMNNLSADIDWEIKAFKNAKNSVFINQPICNYLEGGISVQQHKKSLIDRYKVLQSHFGILPNLMNHIYILFRGIAQKLK